MRGLKTVAGLAMALALLMPASVSFAGTDLNEVGAFLVFPIVVVGRGEETFVTIVNAGPNAVSAHVSFIDGQENSFGNGHSYPNSRYCFECDFEIPLTGNDTEMLVVTHTDFGISIESEDGTVSNSCPVKYGMIVVALEDEYGHTITDNVLLGSEVVVDYSDGSAFSVPAIPFQGKNGGNGDRYYGFNDVEYGKLPRIVAADFIAPGFEHSGDDIDASLALFTLGFERQHPPQVDCSVTGFDAEENPFSNSFLFGCWTWIELQDIQPEFVYPNLGHLPGQYDTHGWLQLNCRVDSNNDGTYEARGGVHGAIVQEAEDAVIRRNDPTAPRINGEASWARLLFQSVTAGDAVTLCLESPAAGLD